MIVVAWMGCGALGWCGSGPEPEIRDIEAELDAEDLAPGDTGADPTCEELCYAELGSSYPLHQVRACALTETAAGAHLECSVQGPYELCD